MKISVVMATYNGERYLQGQLNSILGQTRVPDEVIVCDDRSTDGTIDILKEYERRGAIRLVVNDHNLGLISNFRKAISLARPGYYVALSDQDDVWIPSKLEQSVQLIQAIEQQGKPCMVHTDLLYIDEQENILNSSFRNELGQDGYRQELETLLYGNFVNGCTTLFNPELRRLVTDMPDQITLNHDGWMALLAFTFGRVGYIDQPTVRYRRHQSNASIEEGTKPRDRYKSVLEQLKKALTGNDDFLEPQFRTVRPFYDRYADQMTASQKATFEFFLKLERKSYFIKKLAFRKMVDRYRIDRS